MIKVMNTINSIFPQEHCIVMMAGKEGLTKLSNESRSRTIFMCISVKFLKFWVASECMKLQ